MHTTTNTASGVGSFDRHFCPDCGWLFPEELDVTICERCGKTPGRYDNKGKPIRVAHYFSIADHIKAAFATKKLAKHAKYAWNRPAPPEANIADRELSDVFDGEIMDELFHHPDPRIQPRRTGYITLAFDGVEIVKKVHCEAQHVLRPYNVWHLICLLHSVPRAA
jgi:hypothetical protein